MGVSLSMTSTLAIQRIATLLLPLCSLLAGARQSFAQDARAPLGAMSDSGARRTVIRLTPAQPRQGSVLRITVRPGAIVRHDVFAKADTTRADTLPSVTVTLRPPLDSLRAVLDTLAPRRDTSGAVAASLRPQPADTMRTLGASPDSAIADGVGDIRAELFGERLHFQREPNGEYVALAAIPVDAPARARIAVVITRVAGGTDTASVPISVRRTAYKMEQLAVAPRFGQAPDAALSARIAREQALAAEVSRRSHDTPRLWEGEFQRPRTARVTSAFGDGRQFNGAIQSRHMGLDLAGAEGAPVVATNRGVVALVGDFYYAGNAVYIDHGAGLVTAYFHLSGVDVAKGDTVAAGERIGRVGATGRVTGPHLHWVARYGAITVDPSTLLDITEPKKPAPGALPPAATATRSGTPPQPPPDGDHSTDG